MEKITEKIAALPTDTNYFSLEFFPPKTSMGSSNLRARLDRMSRALKPLFVTVTWGAGGSTATKSLELAELCQRDLGLTTCLHLTCTNMSRALVDQALEDAKALGIRNILALRGDPPRSEEYRAVDEKNGDTPTIDWEFEWAIDLHIQKDTQMKDIQKDKVLNMICHTWLKKVQAGADFIMTQLFFDVDAYDKFEQILRDHPSGAFKNIPIIPATRNFLQNIITRLDEVRGDDEMVKKVGVDILSEMVEHLKSTKSQYLGPRGFHFYTLNLEKAVSFILERTDLIPDADAVAALEPELVPTIPDIADLLSVYSGSHKRSSRRRSSVGSDPYDRIIITAPQISNPSFEATAKEAGVPAEAVNSRANTLAISEGEGSLGREATWDDFPNGRWGDARSPAYGEIDGYGVSLHMSINQAIKLWGHPSSRADITDIFIRHLEGQLTAIPWSEEGLNEETNSIKKQLLSLNKKGWWTVASQPAVNGLKSSDPIFGWGPKNGFVFQKAFVELFLPTSSWETLQAKLTSPALCDTVSFYASNPKGDFVSSDETIGSTNAVTWGAFPGKEIITPTIIEEVSFQGVGGRSFWDLG
ncbi:hypothetical protein DID88_005844 [Monilinia fructigena]|uniref:MTHFR SAM-binding regulatory domain-containing protein n=1 Tax=Monilinia fructigena TaxID=38457 RepID=A0A395J0Z6_9HELO|nr:hypothetical protein DID88_005844 [Monilinia fructigena]